MIKVLATFLFLSVLVLSCKNEDPSPQSTDPVFFVSATPVQETSLFILKTVASSLGQTDLLSKLKYGVKTYKLIYQTSYNGSAIHASGLIFIPKDSKEEAPIISVQHGTTFIKADAPSVSKEFTGTEFFAAAGYVALMPDFIGYGESADIFHPYYDKEHSARAVVDMIKAAKEFLQSEEIQFNEKLFLAGYSEGGYVTLAAANAIENNLADDLTVTAVAAGAGGYSLDEMLSDITATNYYSYPSYLAFILMSYNTTYEWNKPLTSFFNQPYADTLAKYMDGKHDGSFINGKLTTSMDKFFDLKFYNQLKAGTDQQFKEAILLNSVGGWKTQTPIRLYHGTKDEIIPYHNSEITFQNFITLGSSNVSLTAIPNGTHGNSFMPMLEDVIPWFEAFR